ncbi:MAG: N-acetylmuramoyl-L-alanine amidase family protein [Candidatus Polarisedimenticolia bacterium]
MLVILIVMMTAGSWARGPQARAARRAAVDDRTVATLELANAIFLEVQAGQNDSYVSMAQRYCGSERAWAALESANQGRAVRPGLFYAIPFDSLTPAFKARAVAALFPGDGPEEEGWVHRVPPGDDGQRLESIAFWLTGDPGRAGDLAESNGIPSKSLQAGTEVVVPLELLLPAFRDDDALSELVPAPPPPAQEPVAKATEGEQPPGPEPPAPTAPSRPSRPRTAGDLTFVDDPKGPYAIYRLKRGEALYSSVIMKYTGRLDPGEVAQVARQVSALSGIRDTRSIPAGFPVKIPLELILPEYLPEGDPRRASYEAGLAAAGRYRITAQASDLRGVHIILDAGHGGDDIGARHNGVHEDDYVYDIMCRIKELVEKTTGAKVLTTLRDRSSGFQPLPGPFLIDRDEHLLTTPVYEMRQPHVTTAGVNLRWYLVNSYYRRLLREGADPQKVVFLSLHADSLHPSARGAMVYVPGQNFRDQTYGHAGRLYERREVTELRYVKFSPQERERSEGFSRRLASRIVDSFRSAGLPVHADKPVRDHVIRMRRTYAPAVIRSSLVPQSLLLEVVNLANGKDAALIGQESFRQKVATAVVEAFKRHYNGDKRAPAATTTARKR